MSLISLSLSLTLQLPSPVRLLQTTADEFVDDDVIAECECHNTFQSDVIMM